MSAATKAWRTHAYLSDKTTYALLGRAGIQWISDEIKKAKQPYQLESGLTMAPINVMPDHEHLYHGNRTPRAVAVSAWPGDDFGRASYVPDRWLEIVRRQVRALENKGGLAVLEVHPICMFSLDKFATFKRLCEFLSQYKSGFFSDIG